MNDLPNYHIILVRNMAPSNRTLYSRVRIKSERFRSIKYIPYTNSPGEMNESLTEAIKWLKSKGFDIVGKAETESDYILISRTFKDIR